MPPFLIASDFTNWESTCLLGKRERELTTTIPLTLDTKSTTMNATHTDSAEAHACTQVHDNTRTTAKAGRHQVNSDIFSFIHVTPYRPQQLQ